MILGFVYDLRTTDRYKNTKYNSPFQSQNFPMFLFHRQWKGSKPYQNKLQVIICIQEDMGCIFKLHWFYILHPLLGLFPHYLLYSQRGNQKIYLTVCVSKPTHICKGQRRLLSPQVPIEITTKQCCCQNVLLPFPLQDTRCLLMKLPRPWTPDSSSPLFLGLISVSPALLLLLLRNSAMFGWNY